MSSNAMVELEEVVKLPMSERVGALAELGRRAAEDGGDEILAPLISQLVYALESGEGVGHDRVALGEILGLLGDPRLCEPKDDNYWVSVQTGQEAIQVGRFPVTNAEFSVFAQEGYTNRELWCDDGWAWLQRTEDPWHVHAARESWRPFTIPNQPVVGVSWYEASAYARSVGARLPFRVERVRIVRGALKRPYPWGAPFVEGYANTREEVLGRPCAVGLYIRDRTPEGVADLAGNVGEWTADSRLVTAEESKADGGDGVARIEYFLHPGSWNEPSMAAWAKALSMAPPSARWTGLGLRLVR